MLETTFPRIKGDIGNPDTFPFPVRYQTVKGASPQRIVFEADERLIDDFVHTAQVLIAQGVRAITTSCGFLALFHRQLANALSVPVFTSSLLQVPLAQSVISNDQKVGIITASRPFLTDKHLSGVGIQNAPLAIIGMEHTQTFNAVFLSGEAILNEDRCHQEMTEAAGRLMREHPDVGAIVLECTNMPPYADAVRQATGLPVFDAVTMVNYMHSLFG
jgi:Asp/Glu/hydantoin racemase